MSQSRADSFRSVAWAAGLIVAAGLLAYHNTYRTPFEFDDRPGIQGNPSIRHFFRLSEVLDPPINLPVSGRPILNLSFAANYAVGGLDVGTYHHWNLAIHLLAGLLLFGIARPTLELWECSRIRKNADEIRTLTSSATSTRLACAIALIWVVHPLQTESVTYIVQRAESLMGLFYLATIYFFIRAAEARERTSGGHDRSYAAWAALSVMACLLGMATKEVMVSVPLIVLLYDRTFLSGKFKEAWRRHRPIYLGLAATWAPLFWLIWRNKIRTGTSALGAGPSWWDYALTQFPSIVRYLKLSVWPQGQVFDYGDQWVSLSAVVARDASIVGLLLASTLLACFPGLLPSRWRRFAPPLGFLGLWFFAILSVTSLVPQNMQTAAEHRMYLALAPIVAAFVVSVHWLFDAGRRAVRLLAPGAGAANLESGFAEGEWVFFLVIGAALGWMTERRNDVYRNPVSLWADTVAKLPGSVRAQYNLATELSKIPDLLSAAIDHYELAVRIDPGFSLAHHSLGNALYRSGRMSEAIDQYRETIRIAPNYADAHNNLGIALYRSGRIMEAMEQCRQAIRLLPNYVEAHDNLGIALKASGRTDEAIEEFDEALRLDPGYADAHNNLGSVFYRTGHLPEAIDQYREAIRLGLDRAEVHYNLGLALKKAGRNGEAVAEFRDALRLQPDFPAATRELERPQTKP